MIGRWDPERYLAYADERSRPFVDLLARVGADHPRYVVDLGCGPGNLSALLAARWPSADVLGLDSSPEMVTKARDAKIAAVRFEVADLRDWAPEQRPDVLISNAVLQWVPGHLELLPDLVDRVGQGGWFAFQVPGNFDEPSHVLLHELAVEERYASYVDRVARPEAHAPAVYLERLLRLGCTVDAWETTYLHLLSGPDPVFTWISGTGARPVLQALPAVLREEFVAEYKQRLRQAYPPGTRGTVFPFCRVFVVARRPGVAR